MGAAVLDWPGLDHQVIVTTSADETARVWDPRDPGRELARFEGHTGRVWGAMPLDWPGLDHQVIVTTSADGTARVWDPHEPSQELVRFPLFGEGYSIAMLRPKTVVAGSSRGFAMFILDAADPLDNSQS